MQTQNVIAAIAAGVGATSLGLFFRLFAKYPEQSAQLANSKHHGRIQTLCTIPLLLLVFVGPTPVRGVSAIAILFIVLVLSWYSRRSLLAGGADRIFLNRLLLPSFLSVLALTIFTVAVFSGFDLVSLFSSNWSHQAFDGDVQFCLNF